MDFLKFLQGVGAQVNPFDGGKTYGSVMKQQPQQKPQMPQQQAQAPMGQQWNDTMGGAPGYMNSAQHAPIPSFMGNRYAQSFNAPYTHQQEFIGKNGVDPKIFGYPPDGSVQSPDPRFSGYAPEITYNPDPNTNIPYSTHDPNEVVRGNRYVANPTASEFRGVDPMIWGFPEDVGQYTNAPQKLTGYQQQLLMRDKAKQLQQLYQTIFRSKR